MKKTTAKATVAKSAPAAKPAPAVKAAPAKKAAAPVVKAAPVKKASAPAVQAAPAIKKAPAVKTTVAVAPVAAAEPSSTPAPLTTTIVASIDVGFGNTLTLRGEGPGLSWERGTSLDCSAGDLWTITLSETTHPIVCKFLINDEVWCSGEDYTVLPGSSVVLSPTF